MNLTAILIPVLFYLYSTFNYSSTTKTCAKEHREMVNRVEAGQKSQQLAV